MTAEKFCASVKALEQSIKQAVKDGSISIDRKDALNNLLMEVFAEDANELLTQWMDQVMEIPEQLPDEDIPSEEGKSASQTDWDKFVEMVAKKRADSTFLSTFSESQMIAMGNDVHGLGWTTSQTKKGMLIVLRQKAQEQLKE